MSVRQHAVSARLFQFADRRRAGSIRYTIRFVTKEPYFLNESVLGGIDVLLPRHYYDPENLLKAMSVRHLARPGETAVPGEKIRRTIQ